MCGNASSSVCVAVRTVVCAAVLVAECSSVLGSAWQCAQCGSARGCVRHYVGLCAATCVRINMNWYELICFYMRAYELR